MSTVKKVFWSATFFGNIGIVNITTEHGENKTLIGISGDSGDEQCDIQRIIDYGGKISLETSQQLVDHLSLRKFIPDNTCLVPNCQKRSTKLSTLCREHNSVLKPIKIKPKNK